jgi:ribonuclease HI
MPIDAVELFLQGTSTEFAGWWAGRLQLDDYRKTFAGKFERTHTADSLNAGLHKAAALLKRPCLIRLHAPAGYECPPRIGNHEVVHVPTVSQGPIFDYLRQVCRTAAMLAPLPPGLTGLAAAITISDPAKNVWLTVTLPPTGDVAHILSGIVRTSPYRLALMGLSESLPLLPPKPAALCFLADHDYVLSGQDGLGHWPYNGWVTKGGRPLQNPDLWRAIHEVVVGRPVVWRRIAPEKREHLQALLDMGMG